MYVFVRACMCVKGCVCLHFTSDVALRCEAIKQTQQREPHERSTHAREAGELGEALRERAGEVVAGQGQASDDASRAARHALQRARGRVGAARPVDRAEPRRAARAVEELHVGAMAAHGHGQKKTAYK